MSNSNEVSDSNPTNIVTMEEIHKEINLIQECIKRMSQNSFLFKGWNITIDAVILGLLSKDVDVRLLGIIMFGVIILFWYMDAFFLKQERIYRKIYEWVLEERPKGNRELLYNLNGKKYKGKIEKVDNVFITMFKNATMPFYLIQIAIIIIVG